MTKKPDLFDKTAPYTGAYYYQDSLRLDQVLSGRRELSQPEQPHLHDEIEMFLITRGAGVLTVNGVDLPMPQGSLAWLFPFHVHALRPADGLRPAGGEPLELVFCRFSLGMLVYLNVSQRYMEMSVSGLEYAPPGLPLDPEEARRAQDIFEELLRENQEQQQDCEMMVFACVLRLVAMFERRSTRYVEQNQEAARPRMWNALQYVQVHFNKKLDSASVAEVFGMSVSELNSGLRLLTGQNFSQVLRGARVRNACAMMQFGELSLPFIARAVGYPSTPAFYRQFKEVKGCTPDQFRTREFAGQPSRLDSPYAVYVYINENYREDITAGDAAKALFMSESMVNALLEKNFHCTFAQLLTLVRMWVSAGLLLGTALSVGDVAMAAGFNSVRTFTRCFTEEFGTSPTAYRKSGGRESRTLRADGRDPQIYL